MTERFDYASSFIFLLSLTAFFMELVVKLAYINNLIINKVISANLNEAFKRDDLYKRLF